MIPITSMILNRVVNIVSNKRLVDICDGLEVLSGELNLYTYNKNYN